MTLKVLNIVFFLIMIAVNFMANYLPINNQTTGDISNQYPNMFAPAGITFAIWGVIYLLLGVFCIIQFKESNKEIVNAIGWMFIASSILNSLWIFAWHYTNFSLSIAIMVLLLASLVLINIQLIKFPLSLIKISFGLYLGWICIACIANITVWLVSMNWSAFNVSHEVWTIALMTIGMLIAGFAAFKFNNPIITISVIWAFIGIAIKQQNNVQIVFSSALLLSVLLSFLTAFLLYKKLT